METLDFDPLDTAILEWLSNLSGQWAPFLPLDLPESDSVALQSCVICGLVELQVPAVAWADNPATRIRARFYLCGTWQPDHMTAKLRRSIPGWSDRRVSIQQDDQQFARLTGDGLAAQSDLSGTGFERLGALFAAKTNPQPPRIRCRIEDFGTSKPAAVAVAQANATVGDIIINLDADLLHQHLRPQESAASRAREAETRGGRNGNRRTQKQRREGRAAEADQRLAEFIKARQSHYDRLVAQILADSGSIRTFQEAFGAAAVARKWAREDGHAGDTAEENRWATAIKKSPTYRKKIKPLIDKPPVPPAGWKPQPSDEAAWQETIDVAKRRAGGMQ